MFPFIRNESIKKEGISHKENKLSRNNWGGTALLTVKLCRKVANVCVLTNSYSIVSSLPKHAHSSCLTKYHYDLTFFIL